MTESEKQQEEDWEGALKEKHKKRLKGPVSMRSVIDEPVMNIEFSKPKKKQKKRTSAVEVDLKKHNKKGKNNSSLF